MVESLVQVATMQYVHHFSLCLLHAWIFVPSQHALFLSTVILSLCDPEVAAVNIHEVFRSCRRGHQEGPKQLLSLIDTGNSKASVNIGE